MLDVENCPEQISRYMVMAELTALWSNDNSRNVGALICGDSGRVLSSGYNKIPEGLSSAPLERHSRERGIKYYWFEHAERSAIFQAAKFGISLDKSILFCTSFPCADCSRAIILSGVKCVHTYSPDFDDPTFGRQFEVAIEMLHEANVEIHVYSRSDETIEITRRPFKVYSSNKISLLR